MSCISAAFHSQFFLNSQYMIDADGDSGWLCSRLLYNFTTSTWFSHSQSSRFHSIFNLPLFTRDCWRWCGWEVNKMEWTFSESFSLVLSTSESNSLLSFVFIAHLQPSEKFPLQSEVFWRKNDSIKRKSKLPLQTRVVYLLMTHNSHHNKFEISSCSMSRLTLSQ